MKIAGLLARTLLCTRAHLKRTTLLSLWLSGSAYLHHLLQQSCTKMTATMISVPWREDTSLEKIQRNKTMPTLHLRWPKPISKWTLTDSSSHSRQLTKSIIQFGLLMKQGIQLLQEKRIGWEATFLKVCCFCFLDNKSTSFWVYIQSLWSGLSILVFQPDFLDSIQP